MQGVNARLPPSASPRHVRNVRCANSFCTLIPATRSIFRQDQSGIEPLLRLSCCNLRLETLSCCAMRWSTRFPAADEPADPAELKQAPVHSADSDMRRGPAPSPSWHERAPILLAGPGGPCCAATGWALRDLLVGLRGDRTLNAVGITWIASAVCWHPLTMRTIPAQANHQISS